jgi:hypothetical protein
MRVVISYGTGTALRLTWYETEPNLAHLAMCDVSENGKAPIVPPLGWVLSELMRDSFQNIIADCGNEAELGRARRPS